MARKTIRKIRYAVRGGGLGKTFTARDVIDATDIPDNTANNFLWKHCVDNPNATPGLHFVRVCCSSGLYRLKETERDG